MAKIQYITKRFTPESLRKIELANQIMEEYTAAGYDLTLRQLYYQFVARDLIANKQSEYKRLGSVINDGRLAGLVDWNHIVDRTRSVRSNAHWDSPQEIVNSCAEQFRIDKWDFQTHRVEVWIEKDALVGVIENVCVRNDVSFFSCRGYTSQSEMWSASQRLRTYERNGQETTIIHLGDHDPSGIDMTRDIQDRLELFGASTIVQRIALNMDQVEKYQPPPNPAKLTDTRSTSYVENFGYESWELDALEPSVLEALIEETILEFREDDRWDHALADEQEHKQTLRDAAEEMEGEE